MKINKNSCKRNKYLLKGIFLGGLLFVLLLSTQAQTGPGTTGLENVPDTPGVPIDGGITLLLTAGAGYGIKKIRQQRKKK